MAESGEQLPNVELLGGGEGDEVDALCSLSESGLSTYSDVFSREIFPANYPFLVDILHSVRKILAWWMDGTVSYVALDSVLQ